MTNYESTKPLDELEALRVENYQLKKSLAQAQEQIKILQKKFDDLDENYRKVLGQQIADLITRPYRGY